MDGANRIARFSHFVYDSSHASKNRDIPFSGGNYRAHIFHSIGWDKHPKPGNRVYKPASIDIGSNSLVS